MNCVASVYRNGNQKIYNMCMGQQNDRIIGGTLGYYSTYNSVELIDCIKKQIILNYIEHTGLKTTHLLFQPCDPTKKVLSYFMNSQYCIGIAKGLRDKKDPKNFFDSETRYIDASARSIQSGKPIITLVTEMNLSHALNAKQTMSVLRSIINKANVNIEDILVFNLTVGDFWCVTGI